MYTVQFSYSTKQERKIKTKNKTKLKQFTLGQCAAHSFANKINISSNVLFYRRLRPDLHSASHFHFQVQYIYAQLLPNQTISLYLLKAVSTIFFIEYVTDSFFFVFYLIFNQSCIYIYLPLCPLNPVCADFSPRINDDRALTLFDQIRIRIPSL